MSEIGEIKKASEIGKKGSNSRIWHACIDCGTERWVAVTKGLPVSVLCRKCHQRGERHYHWKGGRFLCKGYIMLTIKPDSYFISMADKRCNVLEHRLVMAKHLGRCLLKSEHVHHKNGIKTDNRIDNLQFISQADHNIYNELCHNCELRKEIRMLRWEIKQLLEKSQGKLI